MTQSELSELPDEALIGLRDAINAQIHTRDKALENARQAKIAIHTSIINKEVDKLKELGVRTIIINKNTIHI